MPPTHWIPRVKLAFRSSLQKPIQGQGLHNSSEYVLGQGGLLFRRSGYSLSSPSCSSFQDLHSFSQSGSRLGRSDFGHSWIRAQGLGCNNQLNRGSKRAISQGRPLSVVGTLSRTISIPSVSGPSYQICQYHVADSNQILLGKPFQEKIMAGCNSLSTKAELCAPYLDRLNLGDGKLLGLKMRGGHRPSYSNKCVDYCRKASGSLKNQEPCGRNIVYGYISFDIFGRLNRPNNPFLGSKDFQVFSSAPFSARAATDMSFDGSAREGQLENSPISSDQKILGDRTLKLLSGSCYLPHPDKEETGGEDAHFICVDEQAIGVADGVGGWAELGVDAGQYARELMSHSVSAIQEEPKGFIDPARVLEKAYLSTKAKGSSTACIIALTDQGLHAVNLGDSGFIVVRDGCTIFRSPVQQHDFNFTYQLESENGSDLPSSAQVSSTPCDSSERMTMLKSNYQSLTEKNEELKKQIKDLTVKLQLAEQGKDQAEKQFLVLGEQHKAGPFGTVKALRTNPTIVPDETVNPRLAKVLEKVAKQKELIVALANSNVKEMLQVWFESIKRVGIPNYLVVALDDDTETFCKSKDVPVYRRNPDENVDSVARTGDNHAISGLKFRILREFLQLGYSVLLSDVDIVYLKNPFDYIYRDSDVESMTDGHDNMTAYGYNDVFDEPKMGWARNAHTMRIWVFNSGFFYIRPTIPSIELLDRVADRLSKAKLWDQAVFNEELFFPSHLGYEGLHSSKRTMDFYQFMNSKVLFKTVRKDSNLAKLKPVIVHINYHPDKLPRMKAVVEFYVNGKQDALKPYPDGSEW